MKKSLLALAALTAFAGAASAQSSVTLFGVVDLSVGQVDNGAVDRFLMMQDGNASSRLGFRGVEDLGGGLKAGFWLESALSPDTAGATTFARRSTLSLMGGWGEVRIGRDYTPTFWNWTTFDPFGTNGVGAATNLGLEVNQVPGGNFGTLVRADNTVGYFLPSGLGGFYGQAMVSLGEGQAGNKIYAGRLGWAAGPFNVAGSYGITEASFTQDMTNWNIAGSWNLGFMTLSGFYGNLELDASATASQPFDQENWFVGASVPMGAFTFKGTYGSVERDSNGGACYGANPIAQTPTLPTGSRAVTSCDASQWALGVVYDLSKRTALYGTYSSIDNSGTVFRTWNSTNALQWSNDTNTGWQIGVRHSF
jgi:predicted porin